MRNIIKHRARQLGVLGINLFLCQNMVYAAEYGSLDSDSIALADGDIVTASKTYQNIWTAIYNDYDKTATVDLASGSRVFVQNNEGVRGIGLFGKNTTLKANKLVLDVKGEYGFGLYVTGQASQINLGTGSQISVAGNTYAEGIHIAEASTLMANALTIEKTGSGFGLAIYDEGTIANLGSESSISTNGPGATALMVFGAGGADKEPAMVSATNLTLLTKREASYGIDIRNNSVVDLGSGSTITTQGDNSKGGWVFGSLKADGLTVTTEGTDASAIDVGENGTAIIGANSHLSAKKSGALVASGSNAGVNFKGSAMQRNTLFSGGSYGASAQHFGEVNLDNTDITVGHNGEQAIGIWAGNGVVNATNTNITVAKGAYGVYVDGAKGRVNLTGQTSITTASEHEVAMDSNDEGGLIRGTGKMNILGGIYANRGGVIDLSMAQESVLNGMAFTTSGGVINLSLDQSRWNMVDNSLVNQLTLNNSVVDFVGNKASLILSTADLSGNGTFIMRTNVAESITDKLVVNGQSMGSHHLKIRNQGSLAATGNEVVTVVETEDGKASFELLNRNKVVELGGYQYSLRQNNTNWELHSTGISPSSEASANFLNISYFLNYAQTQSLLQRMGELRESGKTENDSWGRVFSGKLNSFSGDKLSGFDMSYRGVQLGFDQYIDAENADIYLGMMGGLTQTSANYREGSGSLKGYHVALHGIYFTADDFYLNGIVNYSHIRNRFNVTDSEYNRINGRAASDGYGVGVELGKRFYLSAEKTGYYIEPQAQLSYQHQGQVSTKLGNGLRVDLDSYNSMLGRISTLIGYDASELKNPLSVYVKTGYVSEMHGNTVYRLNGNPEKHDFGGGWWENGLGVTTQLNKQHNLYLDGTFSAGSRFNQKQINIGYRYTF